MEWPTATVKRITVESLVPPGPVELRRLLLRVVMIPAVVGDFSVGAADR